MLSYLYTRYFRLIPKLSELLSYFRNFPSVVTSSTLFRHLFLALSSRRPISLCLLFPTPSMTRQATGSMEQLGVRPMNLFQAARNYQKDKKRHVVFNAVKILKQLPKVLFFFCISTMFKYLGDPSNLDVQDVPLINEFDINVVLYV